MSCGDRVIDAAELVVGEAGPGSLEYVAGQLSGHDRPIRAHRVGRFETEFNEGKRGVAVIGTLKSLEPNAFRTGFGWIYALAVVSAIAFALRTAWPTRSPPRMSSS